MTRKWHYLSPEEKTAVLAEANRLRSDGVSWGVIGRHLKVTDETLRRHLDPDYAALCLVRARMKNGADIRAGYRPPHPEPHPSRSEVEAGWAAIPPDTRNFTQRLAGDPLPGRSALDQREARKHVAGLFDISALQAAFEEAAS